MNKVHILKFQLMISMKTKIGKIKKLNMAYGITEFTEAMKAQMKELIKPYIEPYQPARRGLIDDVIDPRETRNVLITGLEMTKDKVGKITIC